MANQQPPTTGPGSFRTQPPLRFQHIDEMSPWLQKIYTAHQTLDATTVKGATTGAGFAMNASSTSVAAGSALNVASGLSSVSHVFTAVGSGSTPTNLTVVGEVSPTDVSKINLYVWQPTSAGDTTPVAASGTITVSWLAVGLQSGSQTTA